MPAEYSAKAVGSCRAAAKHKPRCRNPFLVSNALHQLGNLQYSASSGAPPVMFASQPCAELVSTRQNCLPPVQRQQRSEISHNLIKILPPSSIQPLVLVHELTKAAQHSPVCNRNLQQFSVVSVCLDQCGSACVDGTNENRS